MPQKDAVRRFRWNDMPKEKVTGLLDRRLITGDRMMLAHVYLKKGCIVPRHQHENEQLTYVVDGALHFWIGEDTTDVFLAIAPVAVRAGDASAEKIRQYFHSLQSLF